MTYYEIIVDNEVVGVGTSRDMICYQERHNIMLGCNESKGEYIICDDVLYHADWMLPVNAVSSMEYIDAQVIAISEDTYSTLTAAIEANEEIAIENAEEMEDAEPVYEEGEEITLEYIRASKINEMSSACNTAITSGFDITISDGESHHFSLTTQDQLNLLTLSGMAASGIDEIPYHADGELCRFYSAEDINAIVSAATSLISGQVAYFNSLKAYIRVLDSISEISNIVYGSDIPEEYQSDVLKTMIADGVINFN